MFVLGLIIAVFVGISLGLIGGGGSVITVPMLVYLFGFNAITAVTYSFFIVGTTSLVGSYAYYKKDLLDFKTAFLFGIPSILTIFITRFLILPAIPSILHISEGFQLSKEYALLLLFAIVMVWAAWNMLKKKKNNAPVETSVVTIFTQGAFVGLLTGLTGAGGGFLIIPVLVNVLHVPMKKAVGTSLFIIAINSLLGFVSSLSYGTIDWILLLSISLVAVIGIFIGSFLSTKINGDQLKPAFGWFVLITGIYILVKEVIFK
jgi:uncharacterized membrane protein YfcA